MPEIGSEISAPLSLYLHLPFCKSRCGYCNFYSTTQLELRESYITALCGAIKTAPLQNREAVTVYFGGGTPSLLGRGLLTILDELRRTVSLAPNAEITLEANPGTVDIETLSALRSGGFNRISFGLQADDDSDLRRLGRIHTASEGAQAVGEARIAGFENISVDIMLGTPNQSLAAAEHLCRTAVALQVPHLSAYILKIEPDTPFGQEDAARDCPDSDAVADIYLNVCEILRSAGYSHYEISNFALPGCESRHNSAYWRLTDYLGIGPAAYSFMGGRRFHFPPDLNAFVNAANPWSLIAEDGVGGDWQEYIMLSLRLREGLSLELLSSLYCLDISRLPARLQPLISNGLIEMGNGRLSLTDKGFLVSNSIINFLFDSFPPKHL